MLPVPRPGRGAGGRCGTWPDTRAGAGKRLRGGVWCGAAGRCGTWPDTRAGAGRRLGGGHGVYNWGRGWGRGRHGGMCVVCVCVAHGLGWGWGVLARGQVCVCVLGRGGWLDGGRAGRHRGSAPASGGGGVGCVSGYSRGRGGEAA